MKSKHWAMFGISAAAAAVLIMAVILVAGLLVGSKPAAAPGTAPVADQYDLGPEGYFIQVDLHPSEKIVSPLVIKGQAKLWYFEGSFPVLLKDANGQTLATGAAQAQGDWMSTSMVPFVATLNYAKPMTPTGILILKKDNPSGLPQNDDQVQLAVNFDLAAWGP